MVVPEALTIEIEVQVGVGSVDTRLLRDGQLLTERTSGGSAILEGLRDITRAEPALARSLDHLAFMYRGVHSSWPVRAGVFPVTLDAFRLIEAVESEGPFEGTAWDVGCGIGIVGRHLVQLGICERVLLIDADSRAVAVAKEQVDRYGPADAEVVEMRFPPPTSISAPPSVVVSNPPYWFRHVEQSYRGAASDDLSLLKALVANPVDARRVIFTVSDLSGDIVGEILADAEHPVDARIIASWQAPLPWYAQTDVDALRRMSPEERQRILRDRNDSHTVHVWSLGYARANADLA